MLTSTHSNILATTRDTPPSRFDSSWQCMSFKNQNCGTKEQSRLGLKCVMVENLENMSGRLVEAHAVTRH